jgi:spore germination protein YaaH
MSKTKKIIISISGFLLVTVVGTFVFLYLGQSGNHSSTGAPKEDLSKPGEFSTDQQDNSQAVLTTSAWIPNWASDSGMISFQEHAEKIDIISPVWYEISENGDLIDKRPNNYEEIISTIRSTDTRLVPAIAMFDHELFTKILQSPESLENHTKSIVKEVLDKNYDGIDLDYESTKLSDKEKYFKFVEQLSRDLHQKDKMLIVTVLAKWGDDVIYPSLKETRQVQDWEKLSKYADQIRIMAYDFTFSRSPQPGPIAPLFWIEKVLDYAITKIPKEKIILGIHLYSYEWWCELDESDEKKNPDCMLDFIESPIILDSFTEEKTARSYTYSTVKSLVSEFDGRLIEYQGEQIFRYKKINPQTKIMEERVLVYIDSGGVKKRLELAKSYGIQGVAYWRLGGELDLI